jgi:hypothetical protein
MLFGSLVAGATSEGGGSIAFPVSIAELLNWLIEMMVAKLMTNLPLLCNTI